MNQIRNFITPLHKSAKRDYFDRMMNEKAKCIKIAKKYDLHYWVMVGINISQGIGKKWLSN